MNRKRFSPLFALFFIICSLVLSGCEAEVEEEPVLRPVRAVQVYMGGNDSARTFSGTAQTNRVIDLSFRSVGIISFFDINVGQDVVKGELLAQLSNVEARLAQEQAVSSLNSAESEKNTAELNLERVRSLYETGTSSLSDYEAAKNQFRTAEASYRSAQRSVEIQQEQVRYGEIYAPEDGRISAVYQDVDENVSAGEIVAVLNAGTNMEIKVGLPESVINAVKAGNPAAIRLPSLPGQQYAGIIAEVSPSLDTQTNTYPVTVAITDPDVEIRPGMAANVTFNLGSDVEMPQQMVVPTQSVGEDINGRYVFVLESAEESAVKQTVMARKRQVTIGNLTQAGFTVLSGLQEGEWIATAGVNMLIDGQKVLHQP